MVNIAHPIHFILNDVTVRADEAPGMLALDYVRRQQLLTGTKEGCKEGDCGACTVILGELNQAGTVDYTPMTSCLLPLGELAGKHLVTIEGLNSAELSPVQSAMVDCGGTQCGYCTPGFVVAMTAGLMAPKLPLNMDGLLYAISGNLCRCTGYNSIKQAGIQAMSALAGKLEHKERIAALSDAGALPDYFKGIPQRLQALSDAMDASPASNDNDGQPLILAGGTDLYVQRGEEIPEIDITLLNQRAGVAPAVLCDGMICLDARMTFEAFADDPLIVSQLPQMEEYNLIISSWPVRTRASLGGNICNASPIADMTCLLLALESVLVMRRGDQEREVALKDFYLGYKQLQKEADEVVTEIRFPVLNEDCLVNWEKVSKRKWLDIATVNAAIKLTLDAGRIESAHLALGGVAATPLYLAKSSAYLVGKEPTTQCVQELLSIALTEFEPISDVRGSAIYKRLLARQLICAHFAKLFPTTIQMEVLHEALR